MGKERKWIIASYIAITATFSWILNQVMLLVVGYTHVRNPSILGVISASALLSVVVMSLAALIYFRRPEVNLFSNEVLQEVKKVTWPERKATYLSTVVVVICVMVMAVILGVYDWVCTKAVAWVLGI